MDPGEPALLFRAVPAELRLSAQDKRALKAFAKQLSRQLAGGRPFSCLISNDAELRRLNCEFLGHDYPTDVLSFPARSPYGLGDLAISSERAQSQAGEFGHSLFDEFRILMLHGILHLIGFDHEADDGEMKRAEHEWRDAFQLPNTLTDRMVGAARR